MPIVYAAILININEICFTVSTSVNHEFTRSRGFGVFEFTMLRNMFNFVLTLPVFFLLRLPLFDEIKKEHLKPLVARIIFG